MSTPRYASVQDVHIPIESIEDGMLRLRGGQYRSVLEVSGVQFSALPAGEQEAVLAGFAAFLNGLTYPLQLLVRAQPIDMEGHAAEIERRGHDDPSELAAARRDHVAYVRGLGRSRTLLFRRFYVVVPADVDATSRAPQLLGTLLALVRRQAKPPSLEDEQRLAARAQLRFRCMEVIKQLDRCRMKARQLSDRELAQLTYQCWSPERARLYPLPPDGEWLPAGGIDELVATSWGNSRSAGTNRANGRRKALVRPRGEQSKGG